MTQDELTKVTQEVIAELKKNGTNIAAASVVGDISQVSNLVAYGKNGKVIKVTPQTIQESVVKHVAWNDSSSLNDFTTAGVYEIIGERKMSSEYDNLPIENSGDSHTISARLEVLDSSINSTTNNDDKCITQKLTISNRVGDGSNVYIRTGRGRSYASIAWEKWSTLQTYINVGDVRSLDNFVESGTYSGVWTDENNTFAETFVMVTINDSAVAGENKTVVQYKYSYDTLKGNGEPAYNTRSLHNGAWGEWRDTEEELLNAIKEETLRAKKEEVELRNESIDIISSIGATIISKRCIIHREIGKPYTALVHIGNLPAQQYKSYFSLYDVIDDDITINLCNKNGYVLVNLGTISSETTGIEATFNIENGFDAFLGVTLPIAKEDSSVDLYYSIFQGKTILNIINAEITRAKNAEISNSTAIEEEILRATEAEETLQKDIDKTNNIVGIEEKEKLSVYRGAVLEDGSTYSTQYSAYTERFKGGDIAIPNDGYYISQARKVSADGVVEMVTVNSKRLRTEKGYTYQLNISKDDNGVFSNDELEGIVGLYNYDASELEQKIESNTTDIQYLFEEAVKSDSFEVEELGDGIGINYGTFDDNAGSIEIPFATTNRAGVMSAEDKETLDSLPIRLGDVNVIELEQSQFSNLIWDNTKFVPANNNYNSYILRIPEQTPLLVESSSVSKVLFAFKESPYVGYSTQDFIKITYLPDYPEGLPSGYKYLVILINLPSSSNYDVVVTLGEHGFGKRMSALYKKIYEEIVPSVNGISVYESEATFNNGFILPKNGSLPITDNASYVHTLIGCVEGQRFIVSARATPHVYAWQFLDDSNNILTKYEGAETPVVDTILIAPFGAKKLLVNSSISVNHSVKFWNSNNPENVLSDEIKKVSDKIEEVEEIAGTFDSRIVNVEDVCNNIKGIGEPSSTIDLTTSDYSGLVYGGTSFVKASSSYDSFIFPLTQGCTYKIVDNTGLGYNKAGISTIFTFNDTPALGVMEYVRKLDPTILKSFIPQDNEKYLIVNIHKLTYIDNNFTYISDATGLFKKVLELENKSSNLLQGKTILCLGDSITEFRYQDKRYSDFLAEITGANVINGGIGGTQMSRRTAIPSTAVFSSNREAYACLDLPSITRALNTGDFTKQEAAAQWLISDDNTNKTSDDNTAIIERLKGVDLNSVDIVTIFIGTNDIGGDLGEVGEKGDDTSALNMSKGFYQIIKNLLTANPNLRIYYYCPMPRYFGDIRTFDPENADTNPEWCDAYETAKGYKFPEMVDHQISLAKHYKIPVCDMYRTLGINQWNIASIMRGDISDGTHPYKGFKMIANKIASFIVYNNNLNI